MAAYCKHCVQPETRPGITLSPVGICSACIGNDEKLSKIDWDARRRQLEELFDSHRAKGAQYDCIIPVSGGKDSTYQVYVVKEVYGLKPLCVTYRTPLRTELGQKNLDNLVSHFNVDLIELTVSPGTERKFIRKALAEVGDCGLPEHLGIFSFTLRTAERYNIPLIVWGENSTMEYGGSAADRKNPYLSKEWVMLHGCLKGRAPEDWAEGELTIKDMLPFRLPSDQELERAKLQSIFLGYFLKWDPRHNAAIAQKHGFQVRKEGPVMGIYDFADLDCKLITAHHYPKWHKFGMTRTFDNVSVEIRNGRMTREEGIAWIAKNRDDRPPTEHLSALTEFLDMSEKDLFGMFEKFRNPSIWKKDGAGSWYIPGYIAGEEVSKEYDRR